MKDKREIFWMGFETEKSENIYYQCVGCHKTTPNINGNLYAHGSNCSEVARYFREREQFSK